jgi:rubredoxin
MTPTCDNCGFVFKDAMPKYHTTYSVCPRCGHTLKELVMVEGTDKSEDSKKKNIYYKKLLG